jgi:pimeloyl-ACP methyl ester carboxylesterase
MSTFLSSAPTQPTPQPTRSGHRLFGWIKLGLLGLLMMLGALVGVGAIYQAIATARDRRTFPPPGQLVDVGGYKLHIVCMGQDSPTVILEAGQPLGTSSWAWIQPEVAKTTRVCAYDRAGFGWSDAGPDPHDGRHMAHELHTLLDNADIPGPYVLVGHSWGGLVSHIFAAEYRDEVAGIAWVESVHPDNFPRKGQRESTMSLLSPEQIALIPWLARLGLLRLMGVLPVDPELPAQQQAEYRVLFATTQSWDYIMAAEANFATTNEQARQAGSVGKIPLLVVIGEVSESSGVGLEMQQELQALSSNSGQRLIPGATHNSLLHSRDHAQQTSRAILEVVAAVRTGTPLKP